MTAMTKLLYITSSSYSGSTLLTFLLNQHPEMFTIGELEGWNFGSSDYKCSCGEFIQKCPFFNHMGNIFSKNDLNFKMHDFGTKLKFSNNGKINSYLTCSLPGFNSSKLEKIRDKVLWGTPIARDKYIACIKSNSIFIKTSLEYSSAKVFVDATKNPFRIRLLNTVPDMSLSVMYLVRDIRGVVASNVRKKGVSVTDAAKHWISDQEDISRLISEVPKYFVVFYEDLCKNTNPVLNEIYQKVGISEWQFDGDVREGEHHILGNEMRVTNVNEIKFDERWKTELTANQIIEIEDIAKDYMSRNNNQVSEIISHYINA